MSYVFINHASADKIPVIRDLIRILAWASVPIWVDKPGCIPNGLFFSEDYIAAHNIQQIDGEWREDIPKAIKCSSLVLVCVTKNYKFGAGVLVDELKFAQFEGKALFCALDGLDLNKLDPYHDLTPIGVNQFETLDGQRFGAIADLLEAGGEDAVAADPGLWMAYQPIKALLSKIEKRLGLPEFNGPLLRTGIADSPPEDARLSYRLSFQRRQTTFVGRSEDVARFGEFLEDPAAISWQLLIGPSGCGKSRFAQEVCETARASNWVAGFLHKRDLEMHQWGAWNPNRDCLFVVDDPDDKAASDLHFAITCLAEKRDLRYRVRWLILERRRGGIWYDRFMPEGDLGSETLKDCEYDEEFELASLSSDDWAAIVADTYNQFSPSASVDHKHIKELLRQRRFRMDERRPMQAMMIGAYLADRGGIASGTSKAHTAPSIESVFLADMAERERKRFDKTGDMKGAQLATIKAIIQNRSMRIDLKTQEECGQNERAALEFIAEPIKPDLFGEFFSLQYLQDCPLELLRELFEMCWLAAPGGTRQFLVHTLDDFPETGLFQRVLAAKIRPSGESYSDWIKFELDVLKHFPDEEIFWRLNREIVIGLDHNQIERDQKITRRLLARAPAFEVADSIFKNVCQANGLVSIVEYNIMLGFATREYVPTLLEQIHASGLAIDENTCRVLMRKTPAPELISRLRELEAEVGPLSRAVYEAAFEAADERSLQDLFEEFAATTQSFSHGIVASIVRRHRAELAAEYLQKIERSGLSVRQSDYHRCISVLSHERFELALALLKSSSQSGAVRPGNSSRPCWRKRRRKAPSTRQLNSTKNSVTLKIGISIRS